MSNTSTMAAVLDRMAAKAGDTTPREDEYLGTDGLLHCSGCDGPRQVIVEPPHREPHAVRCTCPCQKTVAERLRDGDRMARLARRRAACFRGTDMAGWCFDNDDRKRPELSETMRQYAEDFEDYLKSGQGLILYGPVGTGKTYMAACVANRVIEIGHTARMTNFTEICNNLQDNWRKQEYMDELCACDLLILDDLGAERKSEYMQELVFSVIDARYRSGKPMVITSNMTQEELSHPAMVEAKRIYDRVLERCLPVKVDGESRRRQNAKESWGQMRQKLGQGVKA